MPYTVTATRRDEKMQSVRNSSLIALAKARVWESEGWRVRIADPEGREHDIAQLEELTAFKPERLSALSAILPADEVLTAGADPAEFEMDDSPALQGEEVHGPWPVEAHGPWLSQNQDTAFWQTGELLSS
ncbi:hypothetical protein SR870_20830 [Rhodopseudomonas palustris]|uniref:hypothetical protein n=1 Tax=Rhodopseudomonas palustris TaxID=1076 RepID=UPI002ACE49AB|nr:hypothetical protein [Rhodopseudomonas palustris]WQG99094.1 hypothetical protein SR870_20830 [Rhodopseudomonas palustris]